MPSIPQNEASGETSSHGKLLEAADLYTSFEFNVIPLGKDKAPVEIKPGHPLPWKKWQRVRQRPEDVSRLPWDKADGIAAICGPVSDHLICVDFDQQDDGRAVNAFLNCLGLSSDYEWVVDTPGDGIHIWLRCHSPHLDGKNKLDRKGRTSGHIELRHEGHSTSLPPSIHPNGGLYKFSTGIVPVNRPAEVTSDALQQAYDAVTVIHQPAVLHQAGTSTCCPSLGHHRSKPSSAYASSAFENELAILHQTGPGSRNDQLNRSAFALGQFIGSGDLDRSEVEQTLLKVAREKGLSEGEAKATIRSGIEGGMLHPRQTPTRSPSLRQRSAPTQSLSATGQDTTWPYEVDERGRMILVQEGKNGEAEHKPIADFVVRITEEIVSEDGSKLYRLQGQTRHGTPMDALIPAQDFEDTRQLKRVLSGASDPRSAIYSRMGEHLAPSIKKLSHQYKRTKVYARTGWTEDKFLIPGREASEVRIELKSKLAYRMDREADLSQGLATLDYLIRTVGPEKSLPILVALFQAPLARRVGWGNERCAVFIQGRTGTFKTAFSQAAMGIYGPELATRDDLLITLGDGATRVRSCHTQLKRTTCRSFWTTTSPIRAVGRVT